MSLALLCSGQGRQHRAMFDLVADHATSVLAAASATLGTDVRDFVRTASDADLHANRAGQIVCVAGAMAVAEALFPDGAPPATIVAGYSVGEIAAWGIARVWSPAVTFAVVDARAVAMDAASGPDDGLGYIRGMPHDDVAALADRFGCAVAIVNPGRLFVCGGTRDAIAALCTAALADGAVSAAPLPVHVASHTPRLAAAVAPLAQKLGSIAMARPALRLMTATDQSLVSLPAHAAAGLARQVMTTIDWAALLDALAERGVDQVLDLGPGSALAEMASAAMPDARVRAVDQFRTLQGVRDWLVLHDR